MSISSTSHSVSHSSSSTSYSLPTQTSVLLHHTEGTQKKTELLKQGSSVFVKNTAEYPYLAILESLHIKNPSKHVAKKTNSGILTDSECADITVTLRWYFTSRDLPDLGLSSGPTYPLPPSSLSDLKSTLLTSTNGIQNVAISTLKDVNPLTSIMRLAYASSSTGSEKRPDFKVTHSLKWSSTNTSVKDGGRLFTVKRLEDASSSDMDVEDSSSSSSSESEDEDEGVQNITQEHKGVINVGHSYQACIPPRVESYESVREEPKMVWDPKIDGKKVGNFLEKSYKAIESELGGFTPHPGSTSNLTSSTPSPSSLFIDNLDSGDLILPGDVGVILEVLCKAKGSVEEAVEVVRDRARNVKLSIDKTATQSTAENESDSDVEDEDKEESDKIALVWTSREKNLFDAGFKRHSGALRNISLGLSTKTNRDVIDFHYRFKIPSQYRKYISKKLNIQSAAPPEKAPMTIDVTPKNQGNTPLQTSLKRKASASKFLSSIRQKLGPQTYSKVTNLLKGYASKSIKVEELKGRMNGVLGKEMGKEFGGFLPKKYRD
ncbi:hypothetical protein TrVE_jg12913 [Triparma verrucosa]|uniref:ELM2 domain-containing protein n=1 Tax=Triparma verrucosa TaxID=1606542 RepID=A0A9W7F1Q2_9STRA|nr:hypothetical protein TrVE_jg12913 [Triparma verrucosa]